MKDIKEYINEALDGNAMIMLGIITSNILAVISMLMNISINNAMLKSLTPYYSDDKDGLSFKEKVKMWLKNKKAYNIFKKLVNDNDIQKFLYEYTHESNLNPYTDKKHWIKLLHEKLSDEDFEYIARILMNSEPSNYDIKTGGYDSRMSILKKWQEFGNRKKYVQSLKKNK